MGVGSLRAPKAALSAALGAALAACAAGAPPEAPAASATAWGFVRLVPRDGVVPRAPGASSPYANPALRDVEFVDYTSPGFTVVYLEGTLSPGGAASFEIRDGPLRPYLAPENAAIGVGGSLRVRNASADPHVLSLPDADLVRRLAPGEALSVDLSQAGEHSIYLLDLPEAAGRLFVAPGRFAVTSERGRFELRELPPGRLRLRAWHPRFPPAARDLELVPGRSVRIDLEMGVGALAGRDGDE